MSTAEMVIRLIDGSDDAQAAFDRPPPSDAGSPQQIPTVGNTAKSTDSPGSSGQNATNSPIGAKESKEVPAIASATSNDSASLSVEKLTEQIQMIMAKLNGNATSTEVRTTSESTQEKLVQDVGTLQQQISKKFLERPQSESGAIGAATDKNGPTKDDYGILEQPWSILLEASHQSF